DIYVRNRGLCARARLADRVVTVCDYNVGELRSRCPDLAATHLDVIYCGVDPERFRPGPVRPGTGPVHVLSVGRLFEKKGFDDLIRAISELVGRGRDVTCEIVGEGPLGDSLAA